MKEFGVRIIGKLIAEEKFVFKIGNVVRSIKYSETQFAMKKRYDCSICNS